MGGRWWDAAGSAVGSAAVVPALDVVHYCGPGSQPGTEAFVVVELGFEVREEVLRDRVVPAHPGGAHGLGDPVVAAPSLKFVRGVLGAPVRVEHDCLLSEVAVVPGHPQGCGAEAGSALAQPMTMPEKRSMTVAG